MKLESFSFDKGINRKKSPLFLEDGELYSCSGFGFDNDGVLTSRSGKTVGEVIDADGTINGIHRYGDSIFASSKAYCPGNQAYFNYIYQRDIDGSYSEKTILANNTRPRWVDYEKFTFVVDGESKYALIDDKVYEWGIENPDSAPVVAAGAAGNPDGDYTCYVTFYIQFPNGKVAETGPSPGAEISPSSEAIEWSNIPVCQYSGDDLVIHRRLYRAVSGSPYLVATLADNTTTSYSDDATDATVQTNSALATTSYSTPPDYVTDIECYLQRIFLIKDNKLYWTESYVPFSVLTTSDVTVTKDNEDLVVAIQWGDQLYLASNREWYRLQGGDPDTWAIKRTFTDNGIINKHTVKRSKFGILGLWADGIYLFDGSINKNITQKELGTKFFTDLDDLSVCYAEFDGVKYRFYYASSGTTVDSCLVIDFSLYPKLRFFNEDFIAEALEFYKESGTKYWAYGGYEYSESGTETITTSLKTGDRGFEAILKKKNLTYLYYDIDTGGTDVTVTIYVDGSSAYTLTLNTSTRQRKRSPMLPHLEGYMFTLGIDCDDSQDVSIYAPWGLGADLVGD